MPISPTASSITILRAPRCSPKWRPRKTTHRRLLIDTYVEKYGQHIPLVRRQDIRGYIPQKPVWQMGPLRIETVRTRAREMERSAARFYRQAIERVSDASIRKLLGDLAEAEERHDQTAAQLQEEMLTSRRSTARRKGSGSNSSCK